MRLLVVLFAGAAWLRAQAAADALSPQILLLAKVRDRAVWNLRHQPNYTCVETVERSFRPAATRKYRLIDTLRLEVALVDGKEMFGWPGTKHFEDTDLRNLVPDGAFGNGNFATHARAIFQGNSATFDYRGEITVGERPAIRFDYSVPLLGSGYNLRVGERTSIVAYRGSIYADPKTYDLERLEVEAVDIPVVLGMARTSDRMDYARTPIGDGEFLLPEESELSMIDLNGAESRNRVRFASCRQFSGESVLTFGDPPPPEVTPKAVEQIVLPSGVAITLRLDDDLDVRNAAIGDSVRAHLQNDVKQKSRVLIAKGATAIGRISRLERSAGYTSIGLEFSEMESTGVHADLRLRLEDVAGHEFLAAPRRGLQLPSARPGEGMIHLGPGRFRLGRGILMFWRTNS